ncbi:hypothetical protein HDE_02465 [Halotydeus destructor]|nr:hypothetical protein HDE_02465 [Halotydeus destructor]
MAFAGTTFFGEVSDLTSRAFWSDSDDDDLDNDGAQEKGVDVRNIRFEVSQPVDKLKVLFVTVVGPRDDLSYPKIGSAHVEISKTFANLYQLENNFGWLVLDTQHFKGAESKLVEATQHVLPQIYASIEVETTAIVSKQSTLNTGVVYLSNVKAEQLPFAKSLLKNRMLPPDMVTEASEASTFEYCIMNNRNCCLFAFPDDRLYDFDISSVELPSVITKLFSSDQLKAENNIYA